MKAGAGIQAESAVPDCQENIFAKWNGSSDVGTAENVTVGGAFMVVAKHNLKIVLAENGKRRRLNDVDVGIIDVRLECRVSRSPLRRESDLANLLAVRPAEFVKIARLIRIGGIDMAGSKQVTPVGRYATSRIPKTCGPFLFARPSIQGNHGRPSLVYEVDVILVVSQRLKRAGRDLGGFRLPGESLFVTVDCGVDCGENISGSKVPWFVFPNAHRWRRRQFPPDLPGVPIQLHCFVVRSDPQCVGNGRHSMKHVSTNLDLHSKGGLARGKIRSANSQIAAKPDGPKDFVAVDERFELNVWEIRVGVHVVPQGADLGVTLAPPNQPSLRLRGRFFIGAATVAYRKNG